MSERNSYAPGTPSWVDIGSPDPDASARFYSQLFGWQIDDPDPDPQTGGYRMAKVKGRAVAGIGPAQDQNAPPWWTTYVTVDDADAAAKRVREAGGQIFVEPFDVMTFGRMAVFSDPSGATFSVWQANEHIGAELVNEHGALTWNELHTSDVESAKSFYSQVFGWHYDDVDMGGFTYTLAKLRAEDEGPQGIAGLMPISDEQGGMQVAWHVYFAVDDADAAASKVTELGGTLLSQPDDIPGVGRFAACAGPHGEVFFVMKNATPQQ
jgi:uncharacterized protein